MKLAITFVLFFLISFFLYLENEIFELTYAFTNKITRLINIEMVSINGSLLSDGKFLIIPDPFQKSTMLEISDNDLIDSNKTIGVISLSNISKNNYTITQKASNNNYLPNTISKLVEINNDHPISTIKFVNNFNLQSKKLCSVNLIFLHIMLNLYVAQLEVMKDLYGLDTTILI